MSEGKRISECFSQRGLSYAGNILEKEMTAGEKGGDDFVYHIAFADNSLLNILLEKTDFFVHRLTSGC